MMLEISTFSQGPFWSLGSEVHGEGILPRSDFWTLVVSSAKWARHKVPCLVQTRHSRVDFLSPYYLQSWNEGYLLTCSLRPQRPTITDRTEGAKLGKCAHASLKAGGPREDSLTWHRERWAPWCLEWWCSPRNLGIHGRRVYSLLHHRGTKNSCQLELPSKHGQWQDRQKPGWEQQRSRRHETLKCIWKTDCKLPECHRC